MVQKNNLAGLLPFSTNQISFNLVDVSYQLRKRNIVKSWIESAAKKEHCSIGEISFNICSDEYLLNMNKEHLKHDYYTDIITFDFSNDSIISGDIYISIDRVKDNAKQEGKTIPNELSRVFIHGILHLCGYKDKKPADARLMRQKEDYYLSLFGE